MRAQRLVSIQAASALVWGGESVVDIARALVEEAKAHEAVEFRGALMDGQIFAADEVEKLSKFPTREEAQAEALQLVLSPGHTPRAAAMAAEPVNSMLSGPAGGVTASIGVARLLGVPDIITYDMGGTSTDACLVRNYSHDMTTEGQVGMADNARDSCAMTGRTRFRNRGDKAGFTNGSHVFRSIRSIVCVAFNEYGFLNVVTGFGIPPQLLEYVC